MIRFRRLAACTMIVLLVLAGQQVTLAKASGPGVTQAVLCTGGGFVTVMLDAEGNPTGPPHICPDATLAFLPHIALPQAPPRSMDAALLQASAPAKTGHPASRLLLPPVRAPPLSV